MTILKFEEYKKIIKQEMINFYKSREEIKKNYIDAEEVLKFFNLKPIPYFEYCRIYNYEPEIEEKKYYEALDESYQKKD